MYFWRIKLFHEFAWVQSCGAALQKVPHVTGIVVVAEAAHEKGDPADTLSKGDITVGCLGWKLQPEETQVRMEM